MSSTPVSSPTLPSTYVASTISVETPLSSSALTSSALLRCCLVIRELSAVARLKRRAEPKPFPGPLPVPHPPLLSSGVDEDASHFMDELASHSSLNERMDA